jgi:ATP-dependent DNA helicase RecG
MKHCYLSRSSSPIQNGFGRCWKSREREQGLMVVLEEQIEMGLPLVEGARVETLAAPTLMSVGRAVSAFLNGEGGAVMLGTDGQQVIGVPEASTFAEKLRRDLAQELSPAASVSVTPLDLEGQTCLIVDVPAGSAPPYVYRDAIYMRNGATTERASARQLSALVQRRYQEPTRWERLPALGFGLADLDTDEVARTVQESSARRGQQLGGGLASTLGQWGLAEGEQPLNSAVVLFGLHSARRYPQLRVRAAHFAGDDQTILLDSRVLEGTAFALLEEAMAFLTRALSVASTLPAQGLTRTDTPAYPWPSVREGLVNALVHRDYAAYDGSLSVSVYPDRLEIWNPGSLPPGWTAADLKAGHVSRPHNPDIAHVFFLRGLVERLGIGGRRIVSACVEAGLPEPEWEMRGGGVLLTLRQAPASRPGPMRHSLEKSFGSLPKRAQVFIRETVPGTMFRRQDYGQRFPNVSERTVRNDLVRLTSQGYISPIGTGPSSAYLRTDLLPE